MPVSTYGASKLAGEALICAYAYMFGMLGLRVPLRQRRRPAPDARRRLRLRPPAARGPDPAASPRRRLAEQVLRPRRRRGRRRADAVDAGGDAPFAGLQRRDRRLHHRARDRRARARRAWGSTRRTRWSSLGGDPAAGRATCPWCASTTERIRALGWQPIERLARALQASIAGDAGRPAAATGGGMTRRPCSSTATACSTRRVRDGCPTRRATRRNSGCCPASRRRARAAGGRPGARRASPTSPTSPAAQTDPARLTAINARGRRPAAASTRWYLPPRRRRRCECRKPRPGCF